MGCVGAALLLLGVTTFIWPPSHRTFAPQCAESTCYADVSDPPELIGTALLATGAALLVIGANGRRLAAFKLPGAEANFESQLKDAQVKATALADENPAPADLDAAAQAPAELEPAEGQASLVTAGTKELVRVEPHQIPLRVLTDLQQHGAPLRSSAEVEWGARAIGQGNNPWYVRLRSGTTYRIAYGGAGKPHATIATIEV